MIRWESEFQRKGYLNFLQWCRANGFSTDFQPEVAYLIQKNHESSEWFIDIIGSQVAALQNEILTLRKEIEELNNERRQGLLQKGC